MTETPAWWRERAPVVVVEGTRCHRAIRVTKTLRESLGSRMTVFAYDRRGRGESDAGASPWSVDREVEDLTAVFEAAGGTPYVVAASSGGTLALEAARRGVAMERLAVYETPSDFQQGWPLPEGYYGEVKPETLVIAGGKSPEYMRNAQAAVAAQLPHGRLLTLPGQTHMVKAKPTTPALLDHFGLASIDG